MQEANTGPEGINWVNKYTPAQMCNKQYAQIVCSASLDPKYAGYFVTTYRITNKGRQGEIKGITDILSP